MNHNGHMVNVLLAEDDDAEYELARLAFSRAWPGCRLIRFIHGMDLLDYLLARGRHAARVLDKSLPCIILLDLNMPVMSGREALMELKAVPALGTIPVIVFTNTGLQDEIYGAYELGANAFIRKPVSFEEFIEVVKALKLLWFDVAELPRPLNLPAGGAAADAYAPSGQMRSSSSSSKPK